MAGLSPEEAKKIANGKYSNKTLIIWALFLVISSFSAGSFFDFTNFKNEIKNSGNSQVQINNNPSTTGSDSNVVVESYETERTSKPANNKFNMKDWEIIDGITPEVDESGKETGFFCVDKSRKFLSREIWYKKDICKGDMISFKYQLKFKDVERSNFPLLYISFGKQAPERTYRLIFPDIDRTFIGFENGSDVKEKVPLNKIKCPVSESKDAENSINLETLFDGSGNIIFSYTFDYHTDDLECYEENNPLLAKDNFSIKSLWSNNVGEKNPFKVGIGTQNEACFRITEFEIINN